MQRWAVRSKSNHKRISDGLKSFINRQLTTKSNDIGAGLYLEDMPQGCTITLVNICYSYDMETILPVLSRILLVAL